MSLTTVTRKIVGCIGKCTSGLSVEELDRVTDHIYKTLTHSQGRKMLREYLKQTRRSDDLDCLSFYEKCCEYIETEDNYCRSTENPTLERLTNDTTEAMNIAQDLDGVPEIDMAILERFSETLARPTRESMLAVLEDTKVRLMNHLRNAHRGFKIYALSPCPSTT